MEVHFQNNKPEQGRIDSVSSSSPVKVKEKDFTFHKVSMGGNVEIVFSTTSESFKAGDTITYECTKMNGPKGSFDALWTAAAKAALEGPLATSGPFKEGEEVKATVKILKCEPKMKGAVQSSYESKYGVVYHYSVTFEHEGKVILSTFQGKEQGGTPFKAGETVDVMVSVKSGYTNIKKVAAPFTGKPGFGGSGSKHDAWARVYSTHFIDARKDNDYAASKAMAIAAANEVIKKMEV